MTLRGFLVFSCLGLIIFGLSACGSKEPAGNESKNIEGNAAKETQKAAVERSKTGEDSSDEAAPFQDAPAAHALYDRMIEAMRKANSLSYTCKTIVVGKDKVPHDYTYRVWLKKPNFFRLESQIKGDKSEEDNAGVLVGDGQNYWIYWLKGRPRFYGAAGPVEADDVYEKTRLTSYMTGLAPPGGHSISHIASPIGAGFMVIDPSTFHGYTDSVQAYLDGVRSLPAEKVGDEECDLIEVSIMKRQRSWYLWLSKADHLPRKLKQIVRVSYDLIFEEQWSDFALDADIPDSLFAWKPPEGWQEWKFPESEQELLKPGTQGPDFQLTLTDGKQIKQSDFRGQILWLYIWRAG
jgi:outer membrane lipoprotein-sorting protein